MSTSRVITDVEELKALPEDSVVKTKQFSRVKTHSSDEWDMVMQSHEILREGGGSVLLVSHPDEDTWS